MDTKICGRCKQEKPHEDFYLTRGKPKSWCKTLHHELLHRLAAEAR